MTGWEALTPEERDWHRRLWRLNAAVAREREAIQRRMMDDDARHADATARAEWLEDLASEVLDRRLSKRKADSTAKRLQLQRLSHRSDSPAAKRRVVAEQVVNLLRFSEFSLTTIGLRCGLAVEAVVEIQRKRKVRRPVTVRGKHQYDQMGA